MKRKFSAAFLVASGFVAGIFFLTSGASYLDHGGLAGTTSNAAILSGPSSLELSATRIPSPNEFSNAFISVAETVNPMVVQIHSERIVDVHNPFA